MQFTLDVSILAASILGIVAFIIKNYQNTKITKRHLSYAGILRFKREVDTFPLPLKHTNLVLGLSLLNVSDSPTSVIDMDIKVYNKNNIIVPIEKIPIFEGEIQIQSCDNSIGVINHIPPFNVFSLVVPAQARLTKDILFSFDEEFDNLKIINIKFKVAERTLFFPFKKTKTTKFRIKKEDITPLI